MKQALPLVVYFAEIIFLKFFEHITAAKSQFDALSGADGESSIFPSTPLEGV